MVLKVNCWSSYLNSLSETEDPEFCRMTLTSFHSKEMFVLLSDFRA